MPRGIEGIALKEKESVKFFSKATNYQILVKPTLIDVKNGIPVITQGDKIKFENGEFSTQDPKVIEFLRKHKAYGVDFVEDKVAEKEVV